MQMSRQGADRQKRTPEIASKVSKRMEFAEQRWGRGEGGGRVGGGGGGGVRTNLRLCEVEVLRELLALGADDVVVLLEGVFQFEQLTGAERRAHALRLAERRQQESGQVGT